MKTVHEEGRGEMKEKEKMEHEENVEMINEGYMESTKK